MRSAQVASRSKRCALPPCRLVARARDPARAGGCRPAADVHGATSGPPWLRSPPVDPITLTVLAAMGLAEAGGALAIVRARRAHVRQAAMRRRLPNRSRSARGRRWRASSVLGPGRAGEARTSEDLAGHWCSAATSHQAAVTSAETIHRSGTPGACYPRRDPIPKLRSPRTSDLASSPGALCHTKGSAGFRTRTTRHRG
jgi:hypothetical protein